MPDAETATPTTMSKAKLVHWQEVQDTVSRLASHKGVLAISILNNNGDIVTQQTTSSGEARKNNTGGGISSTTSVLGNPKLLTEMMKNANRYVQSLSGHDSQVQVELKLAATDDVETTSATEHQSESITTNTKEDISFVRIRTQKDEILVAPKLGYTLVVLQDPALSSL